MNETFKTECPACGQHIAAPAELAVKGLKCPACHTGFVPADPKPINQDRPATTLELLRARTHYPELRYLISFVFGAVLSVTLFVAAIMIVSGFVTHFTNVEESGKGLILQGGLLLLASLAWWKLFPPIASIVVDMADALIEISRK